MRISRADRSRLAEWWFTVDTVLLSAILVLVAAGLVLSLAASPAVAIKKGYETFYFFERHVAFSVVAVPMMLAISLLEPQAVRRLALAVLLVAFVGLLAVALTGPEINGARRWLVVAGHSLQPSELAKPALVVVAAWLFAETGRRPDMPALGLAVGLLAALVGLLVAQPDIGQSLLVAMVWGALYFLSGQSLLGGAALAVTGVAGLVGAYLSFPHVQGRIDRFLVPSAGDNSQVDRAMQSFSEGGFFGRGPGEGQIKSVLPDAHTDFIFAVVAEEYGVAACLALLLLLGFIVMRALARSFTEPDPATRLSIQGLALLFGLQALINMAVNVGLAPAKGMTLPFISSGGSSMLGVAMLLGMLLALTRRRPHSIRMRRPPPTVALPAQGERKASP
ncbi:MAG: putative peptidoglycan glycosyltransferase FtsW [Pseudomonadota bacterium]